MVPMPRADGTENGPGPAVSSPPAARPPRMLRADALSVTALLAPERVRVGLPGATKEAVIEAVVALLGGSDAVSDLGRVRADVLAREALMSTGVGKGLALPHARTPAVRETVAAFAVTAGPVDYGAFDGEPVRLVLLLLGPEAERGQHVRLLSRVSRLMSDDAFRARLLADHSPDAVLATFREAEERLSGIIPQLEQGDSGAVL